MSSKKNFERTLGTLPLRNKKKKSGKIFANYKILCKYKVIKYEKSFKINWEAKSSPYSPCH